jgi:uncharacterized repeat protein (TIGR02543 family)
MKKKTMMQRKSKMTKKHLILLFAVLLIATLTLALSGCGSEGQSLEGKNIVTFDLNGGTLELKTSSVDTSINFAYHPGTYILDPVKIPGYKMFRQGYNFTGWYTTKECNAGDKWNFETPFLAETLTLYAGWEEAIKYTYTVYYVDNGAGVALGSYEVEEGARFDDWRKYAGTRADHTPVGYYSDINFTTAWNESFAHPGGDVDTEIPVYVDYIPGNWKLVDSFSSLRSALEANNNIYLTANIDCKGAELALTSGNYNGIFEGNGFTVSNFKVAKTGSVRPSMAIFKELGANAEIRNVSFANVAFDLKDIKESVTTVKVAALAINSLGAKITNVAVSGTVTTNYSGDLSRLNEAFYESAAQATVTGFTANITVEVQK